MNDLIARLEAGDDIETIIRDRILAAYRHELGIDREEARFVYGTNAVRQRPSAHASPRRAARQRHSRRMKRR